MTRRSRPHLLGAQPSSLNTIQENDSVETFSTSGVTSDGSRKGDAPTTLPPDWNIQRVRRESTTDSLLSIPGLYSFDLDMTREVAPFIRSKSCPSSPLNRAHVRNSGVPALAGSGMIHTPRSSSYTSLTSLTSQASSSSTPATSVQRLSTGNGGMSEEQISQLGKHLSQLQQNGDGLDIDDDDDDERQQSRRTIDKAKMRRRKSTGILGLGQSVSLEALSPMKRALKVFHRNKVVARV